MKVDFGLLLVVVGVTLVGANEGVKGDAVSLGDVYLDSAKEACRVKKIGFACAKFRVLRYIYDMTTVAPNSSVQLWGPVNLVSLSTPSRLTDPMFADSQPRTIDTDFEGMFKFATRQLERLVTHQAVQLGFADDEVADGRGKKKKVAILLPLILFFKLKALLVPILLIVLFIKKMLVIGAFLIPGALGVFKKLHHSHIEYAAPHDSHDYHGSSEIAADYGGYDSYGHAKEYARSGMRRRAQQLAYQNYYNQLNQQTG